MFASRITAVVLVGPVEDENSVTVRKLSHNSLEKAGQARQISAGQSSRALGPELLEALRKDYVAPKPEVDLVAAAKARYSSYDRGAVLNAGIVSWTFLEKVGPAMIEDIDEESAEKLHQAILDLSLPPLDPVKILEEQAKS